MSKWDGSAQYKLEDEMQYERLSQFENLINVKSTITTSATGVWKRLNETWAAWTLARQFGTSAAFVLIPAMLVIGLWVSSRIKESVTQTAGASAALYMENYVEPLVQDLAAGMPISAVNVASLGRLLVDTSLGQKVLTFKIWTHGGLIVASSRPELVGSKFQPSHGLLAAWGGRASAEFDHLHDAENVFERSAGIPLLEVYIPLRERGTERIIAVAEFYEKAHNLSAELNRARALSWLVVAAVTLSMLASLFAIVRLGSETIELQRAALESRINELTLLRARAQSAFARATESNEGYMRRLGADLHDGPAQLISLALLRLGMSNAVPSAATDDAICVRQVLTDALQDIRNLSIGFAVPEIESLSIVETMQKVIDRHERLTGTAVDFSVDGALPRVAHATRLCAYRFVQEALSNACRHAGGLGQAIHAKRDGDSVVITASDKGDGSTVKTIKPAGTGLGLRGLADRIESLGGTLDIELRQATGSRLTARLPITPPEQ